MCMNRQKKILIHSSFNKISKLRYVHQKPTMKPFGIWYSPGREWLNFCNKNLLDDRCKYKYFYVGSESI